MESQPQNPEFRNNPENFHPWHRHQISFKGVQTCERYKISGTDPESFVRGGPTPL